MVEPRSSAIKRILVVQTAFLGDTVLSTGVVSPIRKHYPDAEIWMMTTPASAKLLSRDDRVKGFIPFDKHELDSGPLGMFRFAAKLKEKKFDVVYSIHRSARTAIVLFLAQIPNRICFENAKLSFLYNRQVSRPHDLHDVLRNVAILSGTIPYEEEKVELFLRAPSAQEVGTEIREFFGETRGVIAIAPGSVWNTKMWHWERYRELVVELLKDEYRVALIGGEAEGEVCRKIAEGLNVKNFAGQTSLDELLFVVKESKLLICNDSMALHLASAFKVPNVSIFCATSPSFGFGPWKNQAIVVEKEGLDCKPCRRHGSKVCPTGTEACMKNLSCQPVLAAARKLLSGEHSLCSII